MQDYVAAPVCNIMKTSQLRVRKGRGKIHTLNKNIQEIGTKRHFLFC